MQEQRKANLCQLYDPASPVGADRFKEEDRATLQRTVRAGMRKRLWGAPVGQYELLQPGHSRQLARLGPASIPLKRPYPMVQVFDFARWQTHRSTRRYLRHTLGAPL